MLPDSGEEKQTFKEQLGIPGAGDGVRPLGMSAVRVVEVLDIDPLQKIDALVMVAPGVVT
jgi:hypothetical protein